MIELKKRLKSSPIIYITRDIERALGLDLNTPGYFIISNSTPFGNSIAKGKKNVLLIKEKKQLDTRELLQHPKVKKMINTICETHLPAQMRIWAPLLVKEGGIKPLPLPRGDVPRGRGVVNFVVFKTTLK